MTSNLGIVWPTNINSLEILTELKNNSTVVYTKELKLNSLKELVFDVYSFDKGLKVFKAKNILAKLERLSNQKENTVVLVEFKSKTFDDTIKIRNNIRKKFESKTSNPAFDIFHSATSLEEKKHLENIFFSATIDSYNERTELSQNLTNRLKTLKEWAVNTNTSLNDICIVGGAVLDLYGYKHCDDIDIVIMKTLRDKRNYGPRASMLVEGVDVVKNNYSKKEGIGKWYTDDELITNPDLFVIARGIKFAKLEIVKERKNYSRRDKDLEDLYKIDNNIKLL